MDYREAYEKALQLLNVRFLSEGELKAKLRRRGVDDDVLEDVVAALEGEHFLDDQRLARDVYRYYARKGQYGHLYIVNRLRRRLNAVNTEGYRNDEFKTIHAPMKPARRPVFYSTAAFRPQSYGTSWKILRSIDTLILTKSILTLI